MFLLGCQAGGFVVLWGGVGVWQWKCISYCCAEYAQPLLTQRKWTKGDHCHPLWMPWGMEGIGCTKLPALHTLPKQHLLLSLLEYWTKWIFFLTKIDRPFLCTRMNQNFAFCRDLSQPVKEFHVSKVIVFVGFHFQYSVLLLVLFLHKYFNISSPARHKSLHQERHTGV